MGAAAITSLWPEFFLLSTQQDYFKRLMHVTFCKFLPIYAIAVLYTLVKNSTITSK